MSDPIGPVETTAAAEPAVDTRSGRLLIVVRGLIDFAVTLGRALTGPPPSALYAAVLSRFGNLKPELIQARIRHALLLAEELEKRILQTARALDCYRPRPAACANAEESRDQKTPKTSKSRHAADAPFALRRKSIGALFAELCVELEIIAGDTLWLPIVAAVIKHRGSGHRLMRGMQARSRRTGYYVPRPPWPAPSLPPGLTAAFCTGPP